MTTITYETLSALIRDHFGAKADIAYVDSDDREVAFILYESFFFKSSFDLRYGSFGLAMLLEGVAVRTFLGKEPTLNSDEASIRASFDDIDRFCRLRLPEAFLREFDALAEKGVSL